MPAKGRSPTQEEIKLNDQVKDSGNNRTTLKLAFYAAKASAIPPDTYDQLRALIRKKVTKLDVELQPLQTAANAGSSGSSATALVPGAALIVGSSSCSTNPETGRKSMIQEIN
jgi:hypothetical protein